MRRRPRHALLASVTSAVMLVACGGGGQGAASSPTPARSIATTTFAPDLAIDLGAFTKVASGLYYRDALRGTGAVAAEGRKATFLYSVALPDGRIVESQRTPIEADLGPDMVRGLRDGIIGMRAGGQRRLIIPPNLGYGRTQYKNVPPNSILVFDVELITVR